MIRNVLKIATILVVAQIVAAWIMFAGGISWGTHACGFLFATATCAGLLIAAISHTMENS